MSRDHFGRDISTKSGYSADQVRVINNMRDLEARAATNRRHKLCVRLLCIIAAGAAAVALLLLSGCASTPRPGPTAAELHAELERCKAQHSAHDYAAIGYCFAQARRSLGGAQ